MDPMLTVTIIGVIVIPIVGWVFNTLITKKIDDGKIDLSEFKKTMFDRMDEIQEHVEKTYVREGEYKIHKEYQERDVDQKFKSLVAMMTSQFQSVEDKIDELKNAFKDNKNNNIKQGE